MFVVGLKKKSNEDSSSLKLEMQLYSPSLKVREDGRGGPIAVFSAHDQVRGKVSLDASCYHSGRLTIAVRFFLFVSLAGHMSSCKAKIARGLFHVLGPHPI